VEADDKRKVGNNLTTLCARHDTLRVSRTSTARTLTLVHSTTPEFPGLWHSIGLRKRKHLKSHGDTACGVVMRLVCAHTSRNFRVVEPLCGQMVEAKMTLR